MTAPSSLPPNLQRIVQKFEQIAEPKRRYEYLLWFAKRAPELPEAEQVAKNKVPGCVSQVYVIATLQDGKVTFQGTSDAQITKGLIGMLMEGLNGLTPDEILQLTPDFIQQTGLDVSLTPSRSNGFYNMFQFIQRQVAECLVADSHSNPIPS
ncbi:MAG: SufE family protein [Oculatellaceae cyanobacterium Prado106]|jgi:cysteine desulfuration protein SufE|nr:SufE family protein [Oculatellaceae cyanobacterium Prado106]